jgi:diguanylate cyclase (GGDEF)-like protein/PAS domain S-box-containing protein
MSKWRFPYAAVIVLAIIQALTLGFIIWNSEQRYAAASRAAEQQRVQANSALLAQTLAPYLSHGDRALLLDVLTTLSNEQGLRYAGIYDSNQELITSLGPLPLLLQAAGGAGPPAASSGAASEVRYARLDDGTLAIERPILQPASQAPALGLLQVGYAATAAAPLSAGGRLNLSVAAAGALLSVALLGYLLLPLERQLTRLESGLQRLRNGDRAALLDADGLTANLAEAINKLTNEYQARQRQLRNDYDQRLRETRRLNALLRDSHAVVWEADPSKAQFSYISDAAEALLGHPPNVWLSADFLNHYVHPNDQEWLQDYLRHPGTDSASLTMDLRMRNSAGEWRWLRLISFSELRSRDREPVPVGLLLDVTEEKHSEQRIAYLTDHDELTGLLNRRRFGERCQDQLNQRARDAVGTALLVLGLDRVRFISDTFGQAAGDDYIGQAAQQLRGAFNSALIGRLGDSEFGILLPNADAVSAVQTSAQLLRALSGQTFTYQTHSVDMAANIGIALFPEHGLEIADLAAKATTALRRAQHSGRNGYHLFIEGVDSAGREQALAWNSRLRQALAKDRLKLLFQPIVDTHNGAIRYYDTTLRLEEDGALSAPDALTTAAGYFDLFEKIDRWLVKNSLYFQHATADPGYEPTLLLSVSARHIANPDIIELIRDTTRLYKLHQGALIVAVDAGGIGADLSKTRSFIRLLHDAGQHFALNRFGAESVPLAELQELPLDFIRLDERLVRRLHWSQIDRAMAKAILTIARSLNVRVIAPAVDDQPTLTIVRELGIRLGQGVLFAEPQPRFHVLSKIVIPSSA